MRDIVINRICEFYNHNIKSINLAAHLDMTSLEELKQLPDEDLIEMYDCCVREL